MSFVSSFKTTFNNFGHAIAVGVKYLGKIATEAVAVANGAEKIAPEAEQLIGAFVGPQYAKALDTAVHIFGDVANAIVPLSADALAAVSSSGLNLKLDLAVLQDVQALAALIKQIHATRGATVPPPTA